MKHVFTRLLFGLFVLCLGYKTIAQQPRPIPQTYNGNFIKVSYVRTWDMVRPETNPAAITTATDVLTAKMTTEYIDGLGRTLQTVAKSGSLVSATNTYSDLVTALEYDEFGRKVFQYLPFAANATGNNTSLNDGLFKANPFQQQASFCQSQYPGESFYYGYSKSEPSPLGREIERYLPGDSWVGSEQASVSTDRHGQKTQYLINNLEDNVHIWTLSDNPNFGELGSFSSASTAIYPSGTLYKNVFDDEQGHRVIEFKDLDERLILRKVLASPTFELDGPQVWLQTYYLYDDIGRLRFVLQPKLIDRMIVSGVWSPTGPEGDELCFWYLYDDRGQTVVKKAPGAAPIHMVYDSRNRLVMTQDGSLSTQDKWLVTLYDDLNRVIQSGLISNAGLGSGTKTFIDHMNDAADQSSYPFNVMNIPSGWEMLTKTHYDDYAALPSGLAATLQGTYNSYFLSSYNTAPDFAQPIIVTSNTKGIATWSQSKVLGTSFQYLSTANLYDSKGRLIQVQSTNITNGLDISTNQYDFSGKIIRSHVQHQKLGSSSQTYSLATKNNYDNLSRLNSVEKNLNNTGWKTISALKYDAIGHVKEKKLAPSFNLNQGLETLIYDYNIQSWLLGINRSDLTANGITSNNKFAFEIGYDKQLTTANRSFAASQYNGNVSGVIWKSVGDGVRRKYDFSYDGANRLLLGNFEQQNTGGTSWNASDMNLTSKMGNGSDPTSAYDANGNIKRLQQWGLRGVTNTQIDDLTYNYFAYNSNPDLSNKLYRVTDAYSDPDSKLGDFKDGSNLGADDYQYDVNGNLTIDNNKNISEIVYNHLNLPSTITFSSGGRQIEYVYDAVGNKLKKIVKQTGQADKVTLYLFGVYEDDVLQYLPQEEGRIRFEKATPAGTCSLPDRFIYDYYLKDHLGNIRMVLTEQLETKCYFPATVEDNLYQTEDDVYNIENARRVDKSLTGATQASFQDKLYQTHGGLTGQSTGLGAVLKVMSGDQISLYAESYYTLPGGGAGSPVNMTVNTLLSAFTGSGLIGNNKGVVSPSQVEGLPGNYTSLETFINRTPVLNQAKAYLNWVLFDEQLKVLDASSDPVAVGGGYKVLDGFINNPVNVGKNGYLYVFVSNESNLPVYFDNLTISHTNGPILEETHYYPFGLPIASISSRAQSFASVKNRMHFNGKEDQKEEFNDGTGLDWADYGARMYDIQVARWHTIDPKGAEMPAWSPYNFNFNNPLRYTDPDGQAPEDRQRRRERRSIRKYGRKLNRILSRNGNNQAAAAETMQARYGQRRWMWVLDKSNSGYDRGSSNPNAINAYNAADLYAFHVLHQRTVTRNISLTRTGIGHTIDATGQSIRLITYSVGVSGQVTMSITIAPGSTLWNAQMSQSTVNINGFLGTIPLAALTPVITTPEGTTILGPISIDVRNGAYVVLGAQVQGNTGIGEISTLSPDATTATLTVQTTLHSPRLIRVPYTPDGPQTNGRLDRRTRQALSEARPLEIIKNP